MVEQENSYNIDLSIKKNSHPNEDSNQLKVLRKVLKPKQIENKEAEINTLTEKLSDGDFYKSDPDGFVEMTKELKLAKDQLEEYEERWLELEELSQ